VMKPATRTAAAGPAPARPLSTPVRALVLTAGLTLVLVGVGGCSSGGSGSGTSASSTAPAALPSSTATATSAATASTAATPAATATASSPTYVFPVRSAKAHFGRLHHDYPATDIFAPCGTSVVAPTAGVISEVSRTDRWSAHKNDGADRGGLSISIVGTDGVRYYGSHLRSIAAVIIPGRRVSAGELLGQVGHTGDARGLPCHLHFGISPACGTGDWWTRRGVVSPYPFLKAWPSGQPGRSLSPVKTVSAWRAKHGCPKAAQADP
jgi:peptidoglycan LD-endopeptidase LytH